jgi:hypothetical protein
MTEPEHITQDTFHRELARAQVEQARLRGSIRLMQLMIALLLLIGAALAFGIWQLNDQVMDTTAEVNGLRGSIQELFSDNLPAVQDLQASLADANLEAGRINESMADGGRFTQQVDEAIERVNTEMPQTFESFFEKQGPGLLAEAIESPEVTEAGREQSKKFLLQALDDPAIEQKMKDKMGLAMEDAVRGLTLGGSNQ